MGCCIYPTVPFLAPEHLRQGRDLIARRGGAISFPVTSYPSSIFRGFRVTGATKVVMSQREFFSESEGS